MFTTVVFWFVHHRLWLRGCRPDIRFQTCADDVLWNLDGESWVVDGEGVGDGENVIAAAKGTSIDDDAVALDILHALALSQGDDASELENGVDDICLRLVGDAGKDGVQGLLWRGRRGLVVGNAVIECIDSAQ